MTTWGTKPRLSVTETGLLKMPNENENPLAILEAVETFVTHGGQLPEKTEAPITKRILDAYDVAFASTTQIEDEGRAEQMRRKLCMSSVRGSHVEGVRSYDDVVDLLSDVTDWRQVTSGLSDKGIECYQGYLPAKFIGKAYAAYATLREIFEQFGVPGLGSVEAKRGYLQEDDFYFCTPCQVHTDVITVQLYTDAGIEMLRRWFVGRETSSIIRAGDGDTIVRCNSRIPRISSAKRH